MLNHLIFVDFLLLEHYQPVALRKEPATAPFIGWFKKATVKKSYW